MRKRTKNINFTQVVQNKKLPILTLDERWHNLFPDHRKQGSIKDLEQKVNQLLMRQGKLVNDIKDMKNLKSSLMKDIVNNMEIGNDILGKAKERKLEKNKKYIHEINEKIELGMDELGDLPYKIKEANELLMAESLKKCYEHMNDSTKEIVEITEWIMKTRDELKVKIIQKQEMEERYQNIYSYLHDILGADLMEDFDITHSKFKN